MLTWWSVRHEHLIECFGGQLGAVTWFLRLGHAFFASATHLHWARIVDTTNEHFLIEVWTRVWLVPKQVG